MKSVVKKMSYRVLSVLNKLIPKRKRIFIHSGEKLYDNNEAIFEYIVNNTDYDIVCTSNVNRKFTLRKGAKIVHYSHFATIFYLLTSAVVIDSFLRPIKIKPQRNQISIQLWHGTPLKFVGADVSDYYTHLACPSKNFIEVYKKLFLSDGSNIIINGNPRNDLLFEPNLGSIVKPNNEKFIAWLPTYRHGLGTEESPTDLPVLTKENIQELDRCLQKNNVKLFIKPHPLQSKSFDDIVANVQNIILINDQMLRDDNIALYSFLGAMDALLTDYSSVFYDFLLLDRPIGFVIEDIELYSNGRGFMFEEPMKMMPGMKIFDMADLLEFVSSFYHNDIYVSERKRMNDFANHYQDNKNRERILDLIRLVLN